MNDNPFDTARGVKRTNGFAYGDRVGITEGKWAGACGIVEFSSAGCMDNCHDHCLLVSVRLTMVPAGKSCPVEYSAMCLPEGQDKPDQTGLKMFKVKQVTHID